MFYFSSFILSLSDAHTIHTGEKKMVEILKLSNVMMMMFMMIVMVMMGVMMMHDNDDDDDNDNDDDGDEYHHQHHDHNNDDNTGRDKSYLMFGNITDAFSYT